MDRKLNILGQEAVNTGLLGNVYFEELFVKTNLWDVVEYKLFSSSVITIATHCGLTPPPSSLPPRTTSFQQMEAAQSGR